MSQVVAMRVRVLVISAILMCSLGASHSSAATPSAHTLPIQGVARDLEGVLIPSGDVAVRIYADSLGGSPMYDSGIEFAGTIVQGIFDIVVGLPTPMLLDPEQSYFLEMDVGGVEVLGDIAGGRWMFYPGGGSNARADFEARLDDLEAALGLMPAGPFAEPASQRMSVPARVTGAGGSIHPLLGLSTVVGGSASYSATGNLLVQPVGPRATGTLQVEFGPYYLFAPTPSPAIRYIRDVPGDQGRAVRVRWRHDLRERPYNAADTMPRIVSYALYRRVEPGQAAARHTHPAMLQPERESTMFALPPGEWDVLTTVPATLDSSYQTVLPTLCDSTANGICWSNFFVRAITDQVGAFHSSLVDSGYSVDNLAPGVPAGLALLAVGGGTQLTWQQSTASDFQYFRIYRDIDPLFIPDEGTLVHATTATQWTDAATGPFIYKLTAVDFNGNESQPAVGTLTVSVAGSVPEVLAFAAVAPNPFRGTLSMVIEIPEAMGVVELTVFDVAGRRVRTVARQALPAGRHTFAWDGYAQEGGRAAAGVYIARLTASGRTLTRRVTLLP